MLPNLHHDEVGLGSHIAIELTDQTLTKFLAGRLMVGVQLAEQTPGERRQEYGAHGCLERDLEALGVVGALAHTTITG